MPHHSERIHNKTTADSYIMNETVHYHNVDLRRVKRQNLEYPLNDQQKEEIAKEWQQMARVVDRILFVVVFLTMFISACLILLSPWYLGVR